jgi:hypothetical protein
MEKGDKSTRKQARKRLPSLMCSGKLSARSQCARMTRHDSKRKIKCAITSAQCWPRAQRAVTWVAVYGRRVRFFKSASSLNGLMAGLAASTWAVWELRPEISMHT